MGLMQDVRFGWRMLTKSPVVSFVAALSLALGIASSSAMFALASSFWLHPLPFGDQKGLILLEQLQHGRSRDMSTGVSAPNFRDWRDGATTFSALAAYNVTTENVTGVDDPEAIQVAVGTPNLLDVLRVQPALGRAFKSGEGANGTGHVAVVTHQYWQQDLAADPNVLGRSIVLDGTPTTVIGVMPEGFEMLPGVQAFRPTDLTGMDDRSSRVLTVVGRLKPGVDVAQAQAQVVAVARRLEVEHPEADRDWGALVQTFRSSFPGPTDTKLVFLLIAVSLFGVAIAGANVANLLLGRAEVRMKEVAVRVALGAGRGRILRQMLTESVVLSLTGGALGIVFALYVVRALRDAMPAMIPRFLLPALDVPTLLATVAVAVAVGIAFGLAPALYAVRGDLRASIEDGSRGGTSSRARKRVRSVFVVGQMAVALALLTGAGFLGGAMNTVVDMPPGFHPDGLLTFRLAFPEYKYQGPDQLRTVQSDMLRTLKATPGVQGVAQMSSLPRSMENPRTPFQVVGQEPLPETERPSVLWQAVNPGYFSTMEVPLRAGRLLEESDRADTPPVAVVSQEFVRRFLHGKQALGTRVDILGKPREIVGVVGDITQNRVPMDGLRDGEVFVPAEQYPVRAPSFAVRTAGAPAAMTTDVRRAVWSVDPDQPISAFETLNEYIRTQMAVIHFIESFVFGLGLLAMGLAALGIYGVMAHSVVQERREIGIRMALGARSGQVVGSLTRRGLALTAIGLLAGVPFAVLIRRAVFSALSLLSGSLPAGFTVVSVGILVGAALLASYVPARRAARVDPTKALSGN